jgi:hypothetical protein
VMASATRILSTRVHEHKLLVPTVLTDACSCTASATGAVCKVRRPPAGHPVGARQSGFGFRDCAHLAAPAKRRKHLRKKSERSSSEELPSVIPARAGRRVRRASPRARAVEELGRNGASLGVPAGVCTECVFVRVFVTFVSVFLFGSFRARNESAVNGAR